jgi:NAD-dependent SIR2 family protein deacetylase
VALAALAFEPPVGEGKVDQAVEELREWVRQRGDEKILLLSGAGLSTASGIPDYR